MKINHNELLECTMTVHIGLLECEFSLMQYSNFASFWFIFQKVPEIVNYKVNLHLLFCRNFVPETNCFKTISLCSRTWEFEHHSVCLPCRGMCTGSCPLLVGKQSSFCCFCVKLPSLWNGAVPHGKWSQIASQHLFPLGVADCLQKLIPWGAAEEQPCCLTRLHLDSPGLRG